MVHAWTMARTVVLAVELAVAVVVVPEQMVSHFSRNCVWAWLDIEG